MNSSIEGIAFVLLIIIVIFSIVTGATYEECKTMRIDGKEVQVCEDKPVANDIVFPH